MVGVSHYTNQKPKTKELKKGKINMTLKHLPLPYTTFYSAHKASSKYLEWLNSLLDVTEFLICPVANCLVITFNLYIGVNWILQKVRKMFHKNAVAEEEVL